MSSSSTNRKSGAPEQDRAFDPGTSRSTGATKARLHMGQRDGKDVLIKDFRDSNPLIKAYGRYTLYREEKAYKKLEGLKGFPRCYGREGRDVLVLEYIKGRSLSSFKRGTVPESVFDRLEALVSLMHSKGVVNCDLHRSNVIIGQDEEVFLIDFASAFIFGNTESPGIIARIMMQLDLHAVAKIRARYMREKKPVPGGFFGFFYVIIKYVKSRFRKLKKRF